MNENDNDILRQSLAEALLSQPMNDEEIERSLRDSGVAAVDDVQLERILANTQTMIRNSAERSGDRLGDSRKSAVIVTSRQRSGGRQNSPRNRTSRGAVAALTVAAMSLLAVLFFTSEESVRREVMVAQEKERQQQKVAGIRRQWMTAKTKPVAPIRRVAVGDVIQTGRHERRRVHLPDGSVLYVNESTQVAVATDRRVNVDRGEVFVEVVPQLGKDDQRELFTVVTPARTVTALGTKFGVAASGEETNVLVTQGQVKVSGVADVVQTGQKLELPRKTATGKRENSSGHSLASVLVTPALRASEHLSWTRELMTAAAGALVPVSRYTGGAIIAVDPDGQEMKLSLRKYHVDVHIEDGFARTTIDQTYFNRTNHRLEGTFHFPLPPDASLSRLAMYVNGKLMEGGMAERQHARNTFEKIVHKMKDPALLEWVDGSTFKMRVFPLEGRQEKRIVLSYTQRLNSAYGKTYYRFPAGHSMDVVKEWSSTVRLKGGAAKDWSSPSHEFRAGMEGRDLLLTATEANSRMDRDVVIEIGGGLQEVRAVRDQETRARRGVASWSRTVHEGNQYVMLRYRPELPGKMKRSSRHWVFLFEASADRNPLLARTQIEIIRTLLDNAEHSDTFNVVTANTEAIGFSKEPLACSAVNIANAIETLNHTHLIGALDLQKALRKCGELPKNDRETVLVHTGSAIPVLGEQDQSALLTCIPDNTSYVGVGVGKRWSRPLMKAAASLSGGYFTQINPDEDVAWRAFELSSLLNTPRLLDVEVERKAESGKPKNGEPEFDTGQFLNFADTVVQGEEICAVARLKTGEALPKSVVVTGLLNGRPWKRAVRLLDVAEQTEHLPRSWAKLQIDRLISAGAEENKSEIIRLSKSMYVMSPFTSLLVLENEEMYTEHNIDRGRKDHWALYPCPNEIKVVHEPLPPSRYAKAVSGSLDGEISLSDTVRFLGLPAITMPQPRRSSGLGGARPAARFRDRGGWFYRSGNIEDESRDELIQLNVSGTQSDGFFRYGLEPAGSPFPNFGNVSSLRQSGIESSSMRESVWLNWAASLPIDEIAPAAGFPRHWNLGSVSSQPRDILAFRRSAPIRRAVPQAASGLSPFAAGESLRLRGDVNVEAMQDHGILILKGNESDVRKIEDMIQQVERAELPSLFDRTTRVNPPRDDFSRSIVGLASSDSVGVDFDFNVQDTLPGIPLGWRQSPVRWDDEYLNRNFGETAASQSVLSSGFLFGGRQYDAALSDFDALATSGVRWGRGGQSLPSATYLDDDIQYFAADPDFRLSNQVENLRRYQLNDPRAVIEYEKKKLRRQIAKIEELKLRTANTSLSLLNGVDESFAWWDYGLRDGSSWSELTAAGRNARKLRRLNEVERQIANVLATPISLHIKNVGLRDVLRQLATKYGVNIIVDTRVQAASSQLPNLPVTIDVDNIRLSSALNLLLDQAGGLGYVIEGEVLKITTRHQANTSRTLRAQLDDRYWRFSDLMAHAPALNTSQADVWALMDDDQDEERSKRGTVDAAARQMIERARSFGWERVTFPAAEGEDAFTLMCDGAGRHAYSRTVSEGLREDVYCDGASLKHVYDDLGLSSERKFSRFHRREIDSLVPWLLPSVDDLAIDADVVLVDERTVAIRRMRQVGVGGSTEPAFERHLVFATDGRLIERRIVEAESTNVMLRTIFDADGALRLLDSDGKQLSVVNLRREPVDAPELTVDEERTVVLPMPVRSSAFLLKQTSSGAGQKQDADTSKKDLLRLVLAHIAEGDGAEAAKIVQHRFFENGDRRDGFYVLLSRIPHNLVWEEEIEGEEGRKRQVDLRPSPEGSPLRQFVRQYVSQQIAKSGPSIAFDVEGSSDGFVQHLATALNLLQRWNSGAATKDRTKSQIETELRAALSIVASCRTDAVGWTLLRAIQPQVESAELNSLLAAAAAEFESSPRLVFVARQERVRALFWAGKTAQARKLYAQLLMAIVRGRSLPPIASDMRRQFIRHDGLPQWEKLVRQIGSVFIKTKRYRAAFLFSSQLRELGDSGEANRLLENVLAEVTAESRPDVVMLAVEQLRWMKDGKADQLMDSILERDTLQKSPKLWRYAAKVADDLGHRKVALERLENAIVMEFDLRPEVVNIETMRFDYTDLMNRFEEIVDASTTLETPVPHDLFARVIRVADQWRSLEDDPTTCCHVAARVLSKLERKDLAWSYLTTPLAERSGESTPWRSLAQSLALQQEIDLADVAYAKAFEFEQTNPEILLGHAKMLSANGRTKASRRLLNRIVDSSWQPRFDRVRQEAHRLLP